MKKFFVILSAVVLSLGLSSLSFAEYPKDKMADEGHAMKAQTVEQAQANSVSKRKVPKVRPTGRSKYGKKKAAAATTQAVSRTSDEMKKEMK